MVRCRRLRRCSQRPSPPTIRGTVRGRARRLDRRAGISMGFAEALADDGKLSGRGAPLLRGLVCGLMTTAGGIGHTLPYLIPYFYTATVIAIVVVVIELSVIAWIQWRYMDTPPLSAAAKVMIGGALVLAAGILIGSS